ncbi:MAG TPA: cytochrome b [Stellaceae bacterium]|nr:cytochrome b [Stellaceae bacterium]
MSAPAAHVHDRVTRRLHWLNAVLAVVTVLLALCLLGAPRHGEARGWFLTLHGSCGIAILVLTLFWVGWRLRHRSPPLRPTLRRSEALLARATQIAILFLLIAMPVTGYVSLAAAGKPVSLLGVVTLPTLMPESGRLSQAAIALHLLGEFLVYGLVALHVAAALIHGFVRRDGILERMLPKI